MTSRTHAACRVHSLDRIDLAGNDGSYSFGDFTGAGVRLLTVSLPTRGSRSLAPWLQVRVYVLDSGTRITHEEFGGRALTGVSTVPNGQAGGVINDASPYGCTNTNYGAHGTHCSGVCLHTVLLRLARW